MKTDKEFLIAIIIYVISSLIVIFKLINTTLIPDCYLNNPNYKIDTLMYIHRNDTTYKYKFIKISNYEREY